MRSTAVAETQAYCHQALWLGPFQPTATANAGPITAILSLGVLGRQVLPGQAGSVGALAPSSPLPAEAVETLCPPGGGSSRPRGGGQLPSLLTLQPSPL